MKKFVNKEKIRKKKEEEENREHEKIKSQLRRAVTKQQEYNPFQNCY